MDLSFASLPLRGWQLTSWSLRQKVAAEIQLVSYQAARQSERKALTVWFKQPSDVHLLIAHPLLVISSVSAALTKDGDVSVDLRFEGGSELKIKAIDCFHLVS